MAQFLRVRRRDCLFFLRAYTSKRFRKCYYEVLGVPKTASQKEIKEAFVKLSKELHPDLNKTKNSHNDFIVLNEAYMVLSKTDTRRDYDTSRYYTYAQSPYDRSQYPYEEWQSSRMYTGPRYHKYHDTQDDEGTRKKDKQETIRLVFLCFGIMIVGSIVQGMLIKYPLFFSRDALLKRSKRIEEEYEKLKAEREKRTNSENVSALINRYNADQKLREEYRKMKANEKKSFW